MQTKERTGPGPIGHVNREEIGLYRNLTGIFRDSTGTSGNRTRSQKSSRHPSGTYRQGFEWPPQVIQSRRSCESSKRQSPLNAGPESANRKVEKGAGIKTGATEGETEWPLVKESMEMTFWKGKLVQLGYRRRKRRPVEFYGPKWA